MKRVIGLGLLACSLLSTTGIASAQTAPATIEGTVTCEVGDHMEAVPRASTQIQIDGVDLSTRTGDGGRFMLTGVPAAEMFTVDVVGSPDSFELSTIPGLSVSSGEVLDLGTIELAVCPIATPEMESVPAQMTDFNSDVQGDMRDMPDMP